jgi:hypothetical protein
MTKNAGRPQKYRTADDLFANCARRDDCYIWPDPPSMVIPALSPTSPLAKLFHTVSVARILFTICRFPPAGTRIVRWCSTRFCVNPYHHAEAGVFVKERIASESFTSPLPSQASTRHLAAPSDEELETMKPTDVKLLRHLAESAARAGIDCKGIPNHRHQNPFKPKHLIGVEAVYADPDVPVLVMTNMRPKRDDYPDVAEISFDDIEEQLSRTMATSQPAPKLAEPSVQHVDSDDTSIFAAIRRREEWLRAQRQKDEQGG